MHRVYIDDQLEVMNRLVACFDSQMEIEDLQAEFRRTFETSEDKALWIELVAEEVHEFVEELLLNGRTPNSLKEYCDVVYVFEGLIGNSEDRRYLDLPDMETVNKLRKVTSELGNVARMGAQLFTTTDIIRGFRRVHVSNMSKLDKNGNVIRREDGKVLKSDLYVAPDMTGILDNTAILSSLKNYLR